MLHVRRVAFTIISILCIVAYSIAEPLQKPKVYTGVESIENWLMSEKLDGIRGYWNGKQFLTRKGGVINVSDWFIDNFPKFELDGELWSKQNDFCFIQSTVMDMEPSDSWKSITYNIFEVPNTDGDFPARLQKAKDWFTSHQNKYVRVIPQIVCREKAHLSEFLKDVESRGGEGVIVKDPTLDYHTGRSPHVLKVKNFDDMEGEVISINPGKGRLSGKMGSLTVRIDGNITFNVGSGFSDELRANHPPVGSIITFKYYGFTSKGKPRFASFLRVRKD